MLLFWTVLRSHRLKFLLQHVLSMDRNFRLPQTAFGGQWWVFGCHLCSALTLGRRTCIRQLEWYCPWTECLPPLWQQWSLAFGPSRAGLSLGTMRGWRRHCRNVLSRSLLSNLGRDISSSTLLALWFSPRHKSLRTTKQLHWLSRL